RAIDAAVLILDNAQFSIDDIDGKTFPNATIDFTLKDEYFVKLKQKETDQESKASFTEVFPVLSKLIKNILGISESTEISEESKDQVLANMVALIDFAREKDLVDFNKFKPSKAEAEWQYARLSKSLDIGT
ncbi:MAG: hypothetical protein OXC46_02555, partial [Thaumarchaeota archaeon]|nr:hypothetical protein [Nitrososphaerota archaeon]